MCIMPYVCLSGVILFPGRGHGNFPKGVCDFRGRFATLIVCVYNTVTGKAVHCHAGDNSIHTFKAAARRMAHRKLAEAPPVGVFPSMMVETRTLFLRVIHELDPGDTLFFCMNGLESENAFGRERIDRTPISLFS